MSSKPNGMTNMALAERIAKERAQALIDAIQKQLQVKLDEINSSFKESAESKKARAEIEKLEKQRLDLSVKREALKQQDMDICTKISEAQNKANESLEQRKQTVRQQAAGMEQQARSKYQTVLYGIYESQLTPELQVQVNKMPSLEVIQQKGAAALLAAPANA